MKEQLYKMADVIYVAAKDSNEKDKILADFNCLGNNDQEVIQQAVDRICQSNGETRGKKIILLPGNYYISGFNAKNDCGKVAILIGSKTNSFSHIGVSDDSHNQRLLRST